MSRGHPRDRSQQRYWLPAIATLLCVVALARVPYGYYMLLRLMLCAACVYYVLQQPPLGTGHRVALGALAVLYNPVVPVHLGNKLLWTLVNLATVAYFWILVMKKRR